MTLTKYTNPLGNIEITYDIINDTAIMDSVNYDPEYIKLFILELGQSLNDLSAKNIKKIIQYVSLDDWTNYLENKTKWKRETFIPTPWGSIRISCDILDAFESIANGFGVYSDRTEYKTV